MCVLDDVCATMHAQGDVADMKLLQVFTNFCIDFLNLELTIR